MSHMSIFIGQEFNVCRQSSHIYPHIRAKQTNNELRRVDMFEFEKVSSCILNDYFSLVYISQCFMHAARFLGRRRLDRRLW